MNYKLNGYLPKNIIFDLGGVLLNLNFQNTIDEFIKLGFNNFSEILNTWQQNPIFKRFEIGLSTAQEFRAEIQKIAPVSISDENINNAWNAMLGFFPMERLELLEKLNKSYNLFLFSNINEIHLDRYLECVKRDFHKENLSEYFVQEYYSHIFGYRKPDLTGFELIIKENNLIPSETLFIDDTFANVEAAIKVGMIGHWLEPHENLNVILEKL